MQLDQHSKDNILHALGNEDTVVVKREGILTLLEEEDYSISDLIDMLKEKIREEKHSPIMPYNVEEEHYGHEYLVKLNINEVLDYYYEGI